MCLNTPEMAMYQESAFCRRTKTGTQTKSVWSLTPHHWEPLWVTSLLEFSIGRDLGALKGSSFFYPDLREDLKKQKQNRLEGIELLRTQTSAMW